jgi:hypothetical protein
VRRIIALDIETIPAPEPEDILELSGKKLDEYLKTSLNGDFGQIICIGYTQDDRRCNRKRSSPDKAKARPKHLVGKARGRARTRASL